MKNKPRAASIRPFRHGGYLCIANHVLIWLPSCSDCSRPVATIQKVMHESERQDADQQLTWLCIVGTEGIEARGVGVKDCTLTPPPDSQ